MIGALAVATCIIEPSLCLAQHDANDRQTVAVSGRGEVRRAPVTAEITVGVITEAKSAGKALDENNAATDALIESIRRHGVDQRDIQTTNISVSPQYEQPREQVAHREIVGYNVTNELRARMQDVSKLGELLDDAVAAGGNRIHRAIAQDFRTAAGIARASRNALQGRHLCEIGRVAANRGERNGGSAWESNDRWKRGRLGGSCRKRRRMRRTWRTGWRVGCRLGGCGRRLAYADGCGEGGHSGDDPWGPWRRRAGPAMIRHGRDSWAVGTGGGDNAKGAAGDRGRGPPKRSRLSLR